MSDHNEEREAKDVRLGYTTSKWSFNAYLMKVRESTMYKKVQNREGKNYEAIHQKRETLYTYLS